MVLSISIILAMELSNETGSFNNKLDNYYNYALVHQYVYNSFTIHDKYIY